jgi:hypothetical protein
VKDVKVELEGLLGVLSGKVSKGPSSTGSKVGRGAKISTGSRDVGRPGVKKGHRLRGEARREAWQNVKDLRKE